MASLFLKLCLLSAKTFTQLITFGTQLDFHLGTILLFLNGLSLYLLVKLMSFSVEVLGISFKLVTFLLKYADYRRRPIHFLCEFSYNCSRFLYGRAFGLQLTFGLSDRDP